MVPWQHPSYVLAPTRTAFSFLNSTLMNLKQYEKTLQLASILLHSNRKSIWVGIDSYRSLLKLQPWPVRRKCFVHLSGRSQSVVPANLLLARLLHASCLYQEDSWNFWMCVIWPFWGSPTWSNVVSFSSSKTLPLHFCGGTSAWKHHGLYVQSSHL